MEAAHVTWAHIDFDAGKLQIHGDPRDGAKHGEFRPVLTLPGVKMMRLEGSRVVLSMESGKYKFHAGPTP